MQGEQTAILLQKFNLMVVAFVLCSVVGSPLNVLMIGVDDLRPELHPWGFDTIQTPHIDNFAVCILKSISFATAAALRLLLAPLVGILCSLYIYRAYRAAYRCSEVPHSR